MGRDCQQAGRNGCTHASGDDDAHYALRGGGQLCTRLSGPGARGNERDAHGLAPAVSSALDNVRAGMARVMDSLRNIDTVCMEQTKGALQPISRPTLAPDEEGKKHFAFFSLTHLVCDMLQHDKEARMDIKASSAKIKTVGQADWRATQRAQILGCAHKDQQLVQTNQNEERQDPRVWHLEYQVR